jgi:ubiquinone/menaquinone biosynthesis C-methylase UbiE
MRERRLLSASSLELETLRLTRVYQKRRNSVPERRYSFFETGNLFLVQERERRLLALLKRHGFARLDDAKILEVGCGSGYWLREFIKWGARPENLVGIDLLPDRVAEAKRLCPEGIRIECRQAADLLLPNNSFDLVLQSTVFTSILDSMVKRQVASEMRRVLKRGGLVLWYDFHANNPWNVDVRGVKKREIQRLFPGCRIKLRRITLAPPLVRVLAPYSRVGCQLLSNLPFLCTHYLGAIEPT